MTELVPNERAGAALTATDPNVAKADRLTPASSAEGKIAPANTSCDKSALDGSELFERIHAFLLRFICYPSPEASVAHLLWIAHTHLMDAWFSTPRLSVLSPEPGSGKSRVLEITALLVPRPILSVMSSPAFIMRSVAVQENPPTVLFDEVDAIFGPKARGCEELRGLINSGYRRGASVGRCFSDKGRVLTEELPTYGAVALAGLGDLPDTIMTRSVIIRMRKRASGEVVEAFRPAHHESQGDALRKELEDWAASVADAAKDFEPNFPAGITDRNADVWSPLLAVGELVGGSWAERARETASEFVVNAKKADHLSLGGQLLVDIHRCFEGKDSIATQDLLARLLADEEAPWGDIGRKKLDPRSLAKLLRPFDIRPVGLRIGKEILRGYKRGAFDDAWKRYLPSSQESATSTTNATASLGGTEAADSNIGAA